MKPGSKAEKEMIAELDDLRKRISRLERDRRYARTGKPVGKSSRLPMESNPVLEYLVTLPLDAVL